MDRTIQVLDTSLGKRLAAARKRAGHATAKAAEMASIKELEWEAVEAGHPVSMSMLVRMAMAVGVRAVDLVAPKCTTGSEPAIVPFPVRETPRGRFGRQA